MWLVVKDNHPYVISSYMNTNIGKLWKQWPRRVEEDARAIVRADGKLYDVTLVRRTAGDNIDGVLQAFNEKYNTEYNEESVRNGSSWLFELTPR